MTTGERITALRKGRGMTQEQLAERLSVTRQSVSKWELDQATPEIGCAVALCDVFEVSMDYLVRGAEEPSITAEKILPPEATPPPSPAEETQKHLTANPLTIKGYSLLFGVVLLLGLELCLHILPLGQLFNVRDIGGYFLFLYPVLVPIPALYLVTRRWCYATRREALKHLWKVTLLMTLPVQLLLIGGCLFQLWFLAGEGYVWLFWHTSWETLWYQSLVGEILVLAVQIPLMIYFHEKKWVCYLSYVAAWLSFPLIAVMAGELTAPWMGSYRTLVNTAIRLGLVLIVLVSQVIVYYILPKEEGPSLPPQPQPKCPLALFAVICALGIPALGVGIYYGMEIPGLSIACLPAVLAPLPVFLLLLFYGRHMDAMRPILRSVGILSVVYLPLMFVFHWFISFFVRLLLTTNIEPILALSWPHFLVVSSLSAVIGMTSVPAMLLLRRRPLLCGAVYAAVAIMTAAATFLLPYI